MGDIHFIGEIRLIKNWHTRKCRLCPIKIKKDEMMLISYSGYNSCAFHIHHFNEEILNEIKVFLL